MKLKPKTRSIYYLFWVIFYICLAKPALGTELKFLTQEFAPFSYQVDGVVSGPAAEIIRRICSDMKINCSFRSALWPGAQKAVRLGDANGLFVIGWNQERENWLYFSLPIIYTEYGLFVRFDNDLKFENVYDIKGYRVGVYGPSNTSKSLMAIKKVVKDLKIDMTSKDESAFKKLSVARVDGVYSNKAVGFALIKKLGLKNIRYAGIHKELKYFIGFSKQYTDKAIVDKFNATYRQLYHQGIIQEMLAKYSMECVPLE